MKIPFLKTGDTIALAAPSRKVVPLDFEPFEKSLIEKGFNVVRAGNLNLADNQFAGTDAERISAMNDLFENPEIKAIIAVRGGYGAARIVDQLKWNTLKANPKWLRLQRFYSTAKSSVCLQRPSGAAFRYGSPFWSIRI